MPEELIEQEMWAIFGSKSEYEQTDVDVAERHKLVWLARLKARKAKEEEIEAKNAEAEHDAAIGW